MLRDRIAACIKEMYHAQPCTFETMADEILALIEIPDANLTEALDVIRSEAARLAVLGQKRR